MKPLAAFRKLHVVLLLGGALLAANVSADVLVSHSPANTAVGDQADSSTASLQELFTVPAATLTKISWWGYYDGGSPADDAFVVRIDGVQQTVAPTSALDGVVSGFALYRYDLTLQPSLLFASGGTGIVLELLNDSLDVQWFWQGSGPSAAPGQAHAYTVEGTPRQPVPEPNVPALGAVASLALIWSSRRRLVHLGKRQQS